MSTLTHSQPAIARLGFGSAGPALGAAVRSEMTKIATVRAYRVIAALTVFVGGFAAFAVARFVTDEVITISNVFGFSVVFTAVFAAVSGILIHTSESEHGTIHQTFAAQPRRRLVVVAKAVTTACFALMLGFSGLAAGAAGAALGGVEAGDTSTITSTIGWAIGFATLSGLLGLGIGLVARHSTAAISGLLVWWLVIENLASAFVDPRYARFLPFVAGNGMLGIADEGAEVAFTEPTNAVIFAIYTLVVLAVGLATVSRVDP